MKAIEKDIFDKRIESHLRWILDKKDGMVADFSSIRIDGMELKGIDLRGMYCEETLFINSYLNSVIMTDAILYDSDFGCTKFHNVIMMNLDCYKTTFKYSKFYSCVLTDSIFRETDFSNTILENSRMNRIICDENVKFVNSDLNGSIISDSKLCGVDFTGANLEYVDFSNSDLSGANLTKARLKNTNFSNARLNNTIFTGTRCNNSNFRNARLNNTILPGFSDEEGVR